MECRANTSSFNHACFKIDGFSFKRHSTKVGPIDIVHPPPNFFLNVRPWAPGANVSGNVSANVIFYPVK